MVSFDVEILCGRKERCGVGLLNLDFLEKIDEHVEVVSYII